MDRDVEIDREHARRIAAEASARQRAARRRTVQRRAQEIPMRPPRDWKQLLLFGTAFVGLLLATGIGLYVLLLHRVPSTRQVRQRAVDQILRNNEHPAERALPTERGGQPSRLR